MKNRCVLFVVCSHMTWKQLKKNNQITIKINILHGSQHEETLFLCKSNRQQGDLLMIPESASISNRPPAANTEGETPLSVSGVNICPISDFNLTFWCTLILKISAYYTVSSHIDHQHPRHVQAMNSHLRPSYTNPVSVCCGSEEPGSTSGGSRGERGGADVERSLRLLPWLQRCGPTEDGEPRLFWGQWLDPRPATAL